jgi:hypothetical protein
MKGDAHDLSEGTVYHTMSGETEENQENPVRIANSRVKIQIPEYKFRTLLVYLPL